MKKLFLILFSILLSISGAEASITNKNILVVYYSISGNTEKLANKIHENVGGDIFKIETVKSYTSAYRELTEVAKKEINDGYRPKLKNNVKNIEKYDVIFLGSPCWWGTYAPAISTFLEENDLSGKIIIPFMTHGGSGMGRSENDLRAAELNATILSGLAVYGSRAASSDDNVKEFIDNIDL